MCVCVCVRACVCVCVHVCVCASEYVRLAAKRLVLIMVNEKHALFVYICVWAMWLLRSESCSGLPAVCIKSTSPDCWVLRLIMCACMPISCFYKCLLFITSHEITTVLILLTVITVYNVTFYHMGVSAVMMCSVAAVPCSYTHCSSAMPTASVHMKLVPDCSLIIVLTRVIFIVIVVDPLCV